jgi:hypothetical protein
MVMSNCEHRLPVIGRIMGVNSRTGYELRGYGRRVFGFCVCGGDGLPDAAASAAGGGICIAENVSGVRVDYAPG